jgi:hypothetical protein
VKDRHGPTPQIRRALAHLQGADEAAAVPPPPIEADGQAFLHDSEASPTRGARDNLPGEAAPLLLQHERIFAVVLANPGLTIRQAIKLSGLPKHGVPRLLDQMVEMGHLVVIQDGTSKMFLPAISGLDARGCDQFRVLRNPNRARMHQWISQRPTCTRVELFHQTDAWGWPRISTEQRLGLLVQHDLARITSSVASDRRVAWLKPLQPPLLVKTLLGISGGLLPATALLRHVKADLQIEPAEELATAEPL